MVKMGLLPPSFLCPSQIPIFSNFNFLEVAATIIGSIYRTSCDFDSRARRRRTSFSFKNKQQNETSSDFDSLFNLLHFLLVFFQVSSWKLLAKSKILIGIYLVLSAVLPVYVLYTYSPVLKSPGIICTRTPGTQPLFDAFNIAIKRTFSTIVLGVVVFILTCLMAKHLYRQRRARREMTTTGAPVGKGNQERQIAQMMFIIALVFVLTKIPYMIGQYTRTYGFKKINISVYKFLNNTMPVTTTITYTNFMVNFFIYMFYMASFKSRFCQVFCCRKPAKKYQNESGSSTNISTVSKSVGGGDLPK